MALHLPIVPFKNLYRDAKAVSLAYDIASAPSGPVYNYIRFQDQYKRNQLNAMNWCVKKNYNTSQILYCFFFFSFQFFFNDRPLIVIRL